MKPRDIHPDLPPLFRRQMEALLGAEFPTFLESLSAPAVSGLRLNPLKVDPAEFIPRLPYSLRPVPWCPTGYYLSEAPAPGSGDPSPGQHPYHAAGLYYLQEPSAMLPAELLAPRPGESVLDLSAAPGGKATQLLGQMDQQGVLVANEIHPRRVWELATNLERWGARQTIILNETPERLAHHFGPIFDKVLVDAPCSGEGMFRKDPPARREWTPTAVKSCALRQAFILEAAGKLTRPGGRLVYSTCTFNPQENEQVIEQFLQRNPGWELVETGLAGESEPGRPEWSRNPQAAQALKSALRLWPHRAAGEGHFAALLQRGEDDQRGQNRATSLNLPSAPLEARQAWQAFAEQALTPAAEVLISPERLVVLRDQLYLAPGRQLETAPLKCIHPGWWLGSLRQRDMTPPAHGWSQAAEVRPGRPPVKNQRPGLRFEPSHALALGLSPEMAADRLDLETGDPRLYNYLRGETLSAPGGDGWLMITVDGFSLGWAKRVHGLLKNRYPRGLRQG